ncbi:hypothetical protein B0H12DRAFT_1143450 [Mycena haematopus]|nr:hypothetical protein B0H12DRAFT_1143450 [Mycena haematopus]
MHIESLKAGTTSHNNAHEIKRNLLVIPMLKRGVLKHYVREVCAVSLRASRYADTEVSQRRKR